MNSAGLKRGASRGHQRRLEQAVAFRFVAIGEPGGARASEIQFWAGVSCTPRPTEARDRHAIVGLIA